MIHLTQTILTPLRYTYLKVSTLRANTPMLNASSLPSRKMYTQSYSIQLMAMPSIPLLCGLLGQQDPLVLMCTSGDTCVLPSKEASTDLRYSLALVAKRLCTSYMDPKCVSPFLACRLIALDKSPGVCPIGIGDTAMQMNSCQSNTQHRKTRCGEDISGCLQLCGGQISGIEATVLAVQTAFESDKLYF